jgi:hypothetical protein
MLAKAGPDLKFNEQIEDDASFDLISGSPR